MATPYTVFTPPVTKTAPIVLNIPIPAGNPLQVEVFLGPNQTTKTYTSGKKNFTSVDPFTDTPVINCPIALPSGAAAANLGAYILLYDGTGNFLYGWFDPTMVVIMGGTVKPIVWG